MPSSQSSFSASLFNYPDVCTIFFCIELFCFLPLMCMYSAMDFRYKWLLLLPVGEANLIKSCTMTVDGWSEFRVAFNTLGIHYLKNIGAIDINHAVQKKGIYRSISIL
jgi:hypothetical protein